MPGLPDHRHEELPDERLRRVAVFPVLALDTHRELWRALEEAYPVAFVTTRDDDLARADAAVSFPGHSVPERLLVPCLMLQTVNATRAKSSSPSQCLVQTRSTGPSEGSGCWKAKRRRQPPCRRSATRTSWPPSRVTRSGCAAARRLMAARCAAAVPAELNEREYLRDHMTAGRFWSLLPLVHFLKRLCDGICDRPRPIDACFIIDDPNLRLESYGHVRFAEVARDARELGYHVAVATIPLTSSTRASRGGSL